MISFFNELIYFCISFVTWFHLLHEFHYFCLLHEFTYVCLYELLDVDTIATKEAIKRMKASKHKKHKLLQTTMGPTPCKTVSHQAPSIELKFPLQIVIFVGNNNLFYISTKNNLNHSHHPRLKSEAILIRSRTQDVIYGA
jgi:hypothetical protein